MNGEVDVTTVRLERAQERGIGSQLGVDALVLGRLVLLGCVLGAVTAGVLGRLAMRLLAALNGNVRGIRTDDGFAIGDLSLSGSLGLLLVGVFLGAWSGVLYAALAPLQVGPDWFRTLSIGVGAGVVVATQLVHTDGVDFTFLDPAWLAIGLFVLIPVLHVVVLDLAGRRVLDGRFLAGRRYGVAGLLLSVPVAPLVAVLGGVRALELAGRRHPAWAPVLRSPWWGRAGRGVLAVLFVVAVVDLASKASVLV